MVKARKTGAGRPGPARKGKPGRSGGWLGQAAALVPVSEAQLQRLFLAGMLAGALVLAAVVASMAGVPALAAAQVALLAQRAGFAVGRVEVRGVRHLNGLKIYATVLGQRNHAMTGVDLEALRRQLLQFSWVADARVSRQLPDTIIVDIVERTGHAVLQQGDHLVLIDATGHVLEPIAPGAAKAWMVLSGDGAQSQVAALSLLLEAAPALKPQIISAEWKGNRRWNLTFRTGQVLYLPEGEPAAATALVGFARMDGANRLLGGTAIVFDMRAPDRIYLRVPGHAARIAADAARAKAVAAAAPAHKDR